MIVDALEIPQGTTYEAEIILQALEPVATEYADVVA